MEGRSLASMLPLTSIGSCRTSHVCTCTQRSSARPVSFIRFEPLTRVHVRDTASSHKPPFGKGHICISRLSHATPVCHLLLLTVGCNSAIQASFRPCVGVKGCCRNGEGPAVSCPHVLDSPILGAPSRTDVQQPRLWHAHKTWLLWRIAWRAACRHCCTEIVRKLRGASNMSHLHATLD